MRPLVVRRQHQAGMEIAMNACFERVEAAVASGRLFSKGREARPRPGSGCRVDAVVDGVRPKMSAFASDVRNRDCSFARNLFLNSECPLISGEVFAVTVLSGIAGAIGGCSQIGRYRVTQGRDRRLKQRE